MLPNQALRSECCANTRSYLFVLCSAQLPTRWARPRMLLLPPLSKARAARYRSERCENAPFDTSAERRRQPRDFASRRPPRLSVGSQCPRRP